MVVSPISSYRTKIALTIAKLDRFIHENVHMVLKVVIWMLIRLWLSGRWCGVTWIGGCWVTWLVFSDQLRNILSYYISRHYHSTNSWLTATIIWFLYEEFSLCLQCILFAMWKLPRWKHLKQHQPPPRMISQLDLYCWMLNWDQYVCIYNINKNYVYMIIWLYDHMIIWLYDNIN